MSKDNPLQSVEIKLCGKTYVVRPSLKIIAAIEAAADEGPFTLGQRCTTAQIKLTQLAYILQEMVRDQNGPGFDEIGDELIERGMESYLVPVGTFLLRSFRGHSELAAPEGEVEAPTIQ